MKKKRGSVAVESSPPKLERRTPHGPYHAWQRVIVLDSRAVSHPALADAEGLALYLRVLAYEVDFGRERGHLPMADARQFFSRGIHRRHFDRLLAVGALVEENGRCRAALADFGRCQFQVAWLPAELTEETRDERAKKPISTRLRFEVLRRDGFRCVYCGAAGKDVALHVDHVVAVASGGPTTAANLVTACEPCNLGKSDRSLDA